MLAAMMGDGVTPDHLIKAMPTGMHIYDVDTLEEIDGSPFTSSDRADCAQVCVSPDRTRILAAFGTTVAYGLPNRVCLFAFENGSISLITEFSENQSFNMKFSLNGAIAAVLTSRRNDETGRITFLDALSGAVINTALCATPLVTSAFTLSSDGSTCFSCKNNFGHILYQVDVFSGASLSLATLSSSSSYFQSMLTHPETGNVLGLILSTSGNINTGFYYLEDSGDPSVKWAARGNFSSPRPASSDSFEFNNGFQAFLADGEPFIIAGPGRIFTWSGEFSESVVVNPPTNRIAYSYLSIDGGAEAFSPSGDAYVNVGNTVRLVKESNRAMLPYFFAKDYETVGSGIPTRIPNTPTLYANNQGGIAFL
ncbi:hypothetical protein ACGLWX_09705 [Halomonas sp. HMF6819]|uniref:hypothetical protein n=1 Tax=Halomonas sp. HMF6819 TaxID=3373085 RepID=UPI00379C244D